MSNSGSQTGKVRTRKVARRRGPPSRGYWQMLVGLFCACTVILLLILAGLPWLYNSGSGAEPRSTDLQEPRTGVIVRQRGQDDCVVRKFDNDTDRTIDDSEQCHSHVALDGQGRPIPVGTIHRLESISKSFFGPKQ
jgi:hypothetical protein